MEHSHIVVFLFVIGIGIVRFATEGIYAVSHSQMAQVVTQQPRRKPIEYSDATLADSAEKPRVAM